MAEDVLTIDITDPNIFTKPLPPPLTQDKWSPEQEMFFCNESNIITKDSLILLTEEIDVESYAKFVIGFKYLEANNRDITIFLNSPGGDILYMFSIYDIIRAAKKPVTVIGSGEIASASVLLLACAHRRLVTENACLMSHAGEFSTHGSADAMKEHARFTQWCEKRWAELMAKHTPRTGAYWRKISRSKGELWVLGGDAIVKHGFADEVLR